VESRYADHQKPSVKSRLALTISVKCSGKEQTVCRNSLRLRRCESGDNKAGKFCLEDVEPRRLVSTDRSRMTGKGRRTFTWNDHVGKRSKGIAETADHAPVFNPSWRRGIRTMEARFIIITLRES